MNSATNIKLPSPIYHGDVSIEEAMLKRRSIREYKNEALTLQEVAQLLWAAQGITSEHGFRTAPSAGALYPLEVYVVSGDVKSLPAGVYHYLPGKHVLEKIELGDQRHMLASVALNQGAVSNASLDIVITANYEKTTHKYGERGIRYVHMEAGHAAQNILLQAVALQLGAVPIGAFDDAGVRQIIKAPDNQQPLYIIPIGKMG